MAARKSFNAAAFEWRIEPLLLTCDEAECRKTCERRPAEPPGRGADWDHLKRQDGKIIAGYRVVRGTGEGLEISREFHWQPLMNITQQKCLDKAFDQLKYLNGAIPSAPAQLV